MTIYISQGSAATYLRGDDSFNSNFLHRSVMNLMAKNYDNWSTFVEVIARQSWPGTFDTPRTVYFKQILLQSGQCLTKIERNAEGFDVIFWLAGYTETNFVNSATYRPRRDSSATVCWFRRSCATGCLAVRGCAGTSAGWRQDRQRTTGCCLYTPHTPCRTSEWVSERVGFKRPP